MVWACGKGYEYYEYNIWPSSRDLRYFKATEIIHLVIDYENDNRYKQYSSGHIQKC